MSDRTTRYALAAGLLTLACTSDSVRLLEDDWRSEERLRRMDLTVLEYDSTAGGLVERTRTIADIVSAVQTHCAEQLVTTDAYSECFSTLDPCLIRVCQAQRELCQALTFREIANGEGNVDLLPMVGTDGAYPSYRFGSQDRESRAASWQASQYSAMLAIEHVSKGLFDDCLTGQLEAPFTTDTTAPVPLEQSTAELLSSTLVEALEVGEYAADRGARDALGIAERDRAGISDLGVAARLSWFDDNLSRLMAVQSHVGGWVDLGAPPSWEFQTDDYVQDPTAEYHQINLLESGIGAQPDCSGACATALETIRFSGAPFDKIRDETVTLDTLVSMYIGPRLDARLGDDVYDVTNAATLAASLGVAPSALAEARAWMQHEAEVFARPINRTGPTPPLPPMADGRAGTTMLAFDATTMARPVPPPPMHYLTAARAGGFWNRIAPTPAGPTSTSSPTLPPLRPERAHLFAYVHAVAREALGATTPLPANARRVLSTITHLASARRALEVEVCEHPDTDFANQLRIRVVGLSSAPAPDDFLLVVGTTALRCATEGTVEGVPCGPGFGTASPTPWVSVTGGRASRLHAVEWTYDPTGKVTYLYVVRRRPDRPAGPGGYEPIAGIPLPIPSALEAGHCTSVPYDFLSDDVAARHFSLRRNITPEAPCGDLRLDSPLPLEDIIIDDGDPYEDSWAHHLRVASDAAAHADLLGQQLIQSGLEMDRRSEMAVDELQDLCGAPVNVEELIGDDGSLATLIDPTPCTESGGGCSTGFVCVGTTCVRESLFGSAESYQRESIMDCLGLSSSGTPAMVPIVALGDTPLCVWRTTAAPERLCEGAPQGSCPFPLPESGSCIGSAPPAGFVEADEDMFILANEGPDDDTVPELLNLIGSVDPSGQGPVGNGDASSVRPGEDQCNELRRLRGAGAEDDARAMIAAIRGPFYSADNVRYWAGRIGWRAYPLDFSEITLDGVPWTDAMGNRVGSTGFPFNGMDRTPGIASTWPCAAYTGDDDEGTGLFHDSWNCGTPSPTSPYERPQVNWRMGRAAATLAALSGLGLSELWMPAYYDSITIPLSEFDPQDVTDLNGQSWRVSGSADFGSESMSGLIAVPISVASSVRVWTGDGPTVRSFDSTSSGGDDYPVTTTTPMGFLSFGPRFADNDSARAEAIARTLWEGMQGASFDRTGGTSYGFFGLVQRGLDTRLEHGVHQNNIFLRSLLRRGDAESLEYLNHGRESVHGTSSFNQLSNLFGGNAYDLGNNANGNLAHLFADNGSAYGPRITRRDLLDAMELMCEVARSVPNADVPPREPSRPFVLSIADLGAVRLYAERAASHFDEIARRQVVQDVPLEVVQSIRGEPTSQDPGAGAYGDLVRQLTMALRIQGNAPRDVAAALRDISTSLDIMARNQQIFENEVATMVLRMVLTVISAAVQCTSIQGCVVAGAVAAVSIAMEALAIDTAGLQYANQFDQMRLGLEQSFDTIEAKETEMLNAADDVRRILGQLRAARIGAQSALAGAIFADSDAAGRHYPVNTAMRRVYDINLQRYQAARDAAIRMGAVARMAVEQRFGVNLADENCATLVEPPSTWAADICNTSGVNYGEIRDPDADVGPDAIRQMFIGDYVRRLEHYTESYRFDFPYSSGEDLMVLSVRDDIVRPRGRCPAPGENLLGASNDLNARALPTESGEVSEAPATGWYVPAAGCVDPNPATEEGSNCVAIRSVAGPRISVHMSVGTPGPVPGRTASDPPAGFDVVFGPGTPTASSHYTDAAALVQDVVLAGGTYRFSWYEQGLSMPTLDARTALATDSGAVEYLATGRALADGWTRRFLFFTVPSTEDGTLYHLGIFPEPMEGMLEEQSITVAGLQLENVTGTAAAAAVADAIPDNEAAYGPGIFTASTAQGWAVFDDCPSTDPVAFRDAWSYRCTSLCSGGFQSEGCAEGEEPRTYCYWETVFSIDEERLVGRGDPFGGGFAFGNFNYRSGDVAVNVVGTGVRDCAELVGDACYTTAGIPFSFSHGPPGLGSDMSAYTVRTHSGSLHPVHLFRGQIESGRALAAERYLTNPLSSADGALINDYVRTELRGRPMSGTYRLILWDVPGFDFHGVEDVQILWRYRYFTRTGSRLMCEG